MKLLKNGSLAKLVAFFLIAIVLTCTVALATSGWQSDADKTPESDETDKNGEVDENKGGNKEDENIPTVKPLPEYINYITGMETTQENSNKKPLCFVFDTNSALYGISSSFLTIELPTESGKTRYLIFSDNATATGKIGTLAPTRNYINNLIMSFGGVLFSYGNDDSFEYKHLENEGCCFDFKENIGYHYTEYTEYAYTNADLIKAFIKNIGVNTVFTENPQMPYDFIPPETEGKKLDKSAKSVIINFGNGNSTELKYSKEENKYKLTKNNQSVTDLLNDKEQLYTNAFILFANSTTYETENATQSVLDTMGGGRGYYLTGGEYEEIFWNYDEDGNLIFLNSNGERLKINRGTSYIAFQKASLSGSISFS